MNSRGLDLSPTDIFKSLIIGDLDERTAQECARKWEDAEEALGRDDFADLFLHIRMVFATRRGERELLKEFPEQVLSHYLPGRAKSFVNDVVVPYADAYVQIRDASYSAASGAEQVNAWFKRLQQIDNNDWRPAALWALRTHGKDPAWLDAFFNALERLAASMFIRRVYTTPRVTRYADLLRELNAGRELDAPSFILTDTEKTETLDRLDADLYLVARTRKYVLLRLDEMLASKPGVSYDHPLITVEHILPQNPKRGSDWLRHFTDDQRQQWTHRRPKRRPSTSPASMASPPSR
ncbi:HNH endonuclease family protein [Streptomyces sp. NRRL F-5122]|uniref:HNH endonuclease family protein n=1 Tax=Streptomyces sp. NRRL F-5122 TaxID=1609098 RepID=UPI0018FE7A28|nr:HNH endonuclease family protein [Streptomyces sp. NRRL F-5122]